MSNSSSLSREEAPAPARSREDGAGASGVTDVPFLEAYRAHGEILAALESFNNGVAVPGGEGLQMLMRLDDSSRAVQERLCQEYFHHPATLNQLENTLWNRIFSLYWQFKRGYRALIREHNANPDNRQTKSNLALITARALHYSGASFKWGYIRHLPVDPKIWKSLHDLYRTSERGGFTSHRIRLYENTEHTSCSEEYLRILLLDLLTPLSLSPTQIEIADQWLRRRVKSVQLDDAYAPDKHWFYVNLAEAAGARNVDASATGPKLRFLAMGELLGRIDDVLAGAGDLASLSRLDVVEDWQQVMSLELASPARNRWHATSVMRPHPREATQQIQRLFQHFRVQWSDDGYQRRHSREEVRQIVEVACDLPAICASLLSEEVMGPPGGTQDAPVSEEAVHLPEHWAVQNRSEGGYGLCAPAEAQGRIRVNGLVGLKDGSHAGGWEIGAIRRISHESPEEISVGVETLSRVPKRVELRSLDRAVLANVNRITSAEGPEVGTIEAILLSDIDDPTTTDSLILPFADYPSRHFDLCDGDRTYRIRLAAVLERTETWIRVEIDDVVTQGGPGLP